MSKKFSCNGCGAGLNLGNAKYINGDIMSVMVVVCEYCGVENQVNQRAQSAFNQSGQVVYGTVTNIDGGVTGAVISGQFPGNSTVVVSGDGNSTVVVSGRRNTVVASRGGVAVGGSIKGGITINNK